MLDNPFAFMLFFSIGTMCISALLLAGTGKDIFHKVFWVAAFVFVAWMAVAMFILMFAVAQS